MGPGIAAAYLDCVQAHGQAACDALAPPQGDAAAMAVGLLLLVVLVGVALGLALRPQRTAKPGAAIDLQLALRSDLDGQS